MPATTTSLNKLLYWPLLAFVGFAHATPLVSCPSVYTDGARLGALDNAELFQGPPKNLASMIPDLETSVWELDGYQQNALNRGESLYLVCHYKGIKATVNIEVPRDATLCKLEGTASGGTAAWCGTKPRQSVKSNAKGAHGHQS